MQVALRAAAHTCCRVAGLPHRPCTAAAATYAAAAMATGVGVAMGTCVMECKTPSVKEQLGSILTRLDGVESALAKTNDGVVIRPGRAADAEPILEMIRDLAIFEKELDQLQMTAATLRRDGWPTAAEVSVGARPRFDTFVAEVNGDTVGFALYFHIYSTWEGLSIYLEDLYVKPEARGKGVGSALIRAIAQTAKDKNCARFQWQVIDWNSPAIDFYKERLGARERVETGGAKWLNYIMDRDAIDEFLKS